MAAVTFAKGGENTAVSIPLFANSDGSALLFTRVIFAVMIVWCALGYYLGVTATRRKVDRYGHVRAPLFLIGLGLYILLGA